jgi:hypothetical protein
MPYMITRAKESDVSVQAAPTPTGSEKQHRRLMTGLGQNR